MDLHYIRLDSLYTAITYHWILDTLYSQQRTRHHDSVSETHQRGRNWADKPDRPATMPSKPNGLSSPSTSTAHLSRSPPNAPPIDYASTAPIPPSGSKHVNGQGDEEVPDHLYTRLPDHLMMTDEKGRKVPDYLRMILMCPSVFLDLRGPKLTEWIAKVYAQPLNLPETPLTYAANLSARFGNEVR
jgi:hypothetical protein